MPHVERPDRSDPSPGTQPYTVGLRCLRCDSIYASEELDYVCPHHANTGSDMGTLDVLYDYETIRKAIDPADLINDPDRSIARWTPLLPIAARSSLPPLAVGGTPFTRVPRLGESLGLANLFVKDDGRNPSGSLKDRASAIAVARAQEMGSKVVATASTGNAAAALAGQCAAAGQPSVIFVPKTAPQAKIAQLLIYGSTVLAIDGSYDQAFDLCMEACEAFGWYNRNTGYNPYMTEGKKTVAYEIAQGVARSEKREALLAVPDAVFVSVGDGCIIGGVHKGFRDLHALGWIERMPRIYGVQSTRSAALFKAWQSGQEIPDPFPATTRADSISVDSPRDPVKALNAVRQTGGAYIAVEDEAILTAMQPMARLGAVFAEPAGAAALAGLHQARKDQLIGDNETVVIINTGNGLKDVPAAIQVTGGTTVIEPTLDAVRAALGQR
jgi:threonine synthase